MKKRKFMGALFFFIMILFFGSCNNTKRVKVNECLGVEIPKHASDIEYYKVSRSEDDVKPYNIYIRFKIDSIGFEKIIQDTKLISDKSDFVKDMCLEKVDKLFSKNIWDFKVGDFIQKNASWWNPNSNNDVLLYASFYKEKGITKIENCYLKDWDGRILLSYNKAEKYVYILIQVYMGSSSTGLRRS